MSCQEKVAKKKARPLRRPAMPGSLRCSGATGGCGTRPCGPQTVLAEIPRPACVARRSTWGPKGVAADRLEQKTQLTGFYGRLAKTPISTVDRNFETLFPQPSAASSSAGRAGVVGSHCLSRRRVHANRPAHRVAQGTPKGRRPRGRLFFGYFLLAKQKKVRPPARRKPKPIEATSPAPRPAANGRPRAPR